MERHFKHKGNPAPVPMSRDISCRNFKGLLAYIRKHHGKRGIRELTDGLLDGSYFVQDKYAPDRIVPISEEHLTDSAYWVSNEFSLALLSNVNKVVRSPNPLYTAGSAMVREDLSKTDLFMAGIAGIEKMARRAARLNARFNRTKDVQLLEMEADRALFELRYRPGFRVTKDVCRWNLGIYAGIAQVSGHAEASGQETACVLDGDPACRFEITWKKRSLFSRLLRMGPGRLFPFGTRDLITEYEKIIDERDLLIDRLTRSEEKYRRLFNDSLDAMSLSQDGKLIDVNRAWLELHDVSQKTEVLGKDLLDVIHPDDRHILSARRTQWPDVNGRLVQMRDLTRSGRSKSVEVYSTRIKIGGATSILATMHDITNRKQTEEVLRGIEEQLRLFIEHTPAPVAVCDREMRYLAYSRRWIEDYRLPQEDLIGRCHYDVFESIPEKWKQEHQKCFAGEIIENEEEPFQRADGSVDWVRRNVFPWRDSHGRIGGLIMFTEVITHRKLAEQALKESEEKYRKLVENAADAIFIVQDETIKFPNPKALAVLGISEAPEQPISFSRWIHPEDRTDVLDLYRKVLAEEKEQPSEHTFRLIDFQGIAYTMQLTAVAIEWTGQPAVLSFLRDVTEQKKIAESLRQAQKLEAIGTLAGGIAHDFNNLLMGIQGRASMMMHDAAGPHAISEHVQAIEEYVRSATDLTDRLLGFARGGKYEVKPLDLNELVRNSSAMFGRTRKELRIRTVLSAEPAVVEADRGQIEQVLLNLYVNAWQAMPEGGDLHLQVQVVALEAAYCRSQKIEPGPYARVSITDTGIGMDKSTIERIFDPFFTTKAKSRGTGLGLASAYGIIRNHGGMIAVYSEIGRGSAFHIYLPLSSKTTNREEVREGAPVRGSETILLVEDEKMIQEATGAMLETLGYTVLLASNGEEAVDIVRNRGEDIQLVILDLIMPGMGGGKTFDQIRRIRPKMPVLLSSGYAINGQPMEIMNRGCNGFIQKPFNISELSQKVRRILEDPADKFNRSTMRSGEGGVSKA